MRTAQEHYAEHLAPVYLWMVGGVEAAIASAEAELEELGLPNQPGQSIIDLGAGFGAHAIPLARRGAHVTAVDTSTELLNALDTLRGSLPIQGVHDDLVHFLDRREAPVSAILCMGDTLTHLPSIQTAVDLFHLAWELLKPGGLLVLTFRDYSNELLGEQRLIPVRADDTRILTCILEYEPDSVIVHDLLHEREDSGWQTRVSAYRKLRLPPADLLAHLREIGFSARQEAGPRGMVRLVATKM